MCFDHLIHVINNINLTRPKFKTLQIRTPSNLLLINLAVVEFLLAFVAVPMDVLSLLNDGWGPGKEVCITTGTVATTSGMIIRSRILITNLF